jgi:hypothetical protein
MAIITTEILPQAFELIRDRISDILIEEIQGQLDLNGSLKAMFPDKIEIGVERSVPVSFSETTWVNVSFSAGEYGNQDAKSSDGNHTFFIEAYTTSPETQNERGDTSSAKMAQRILGVCKAILEASHYQTLGFAPPFISRRYVGRIDIAEIPNQDTASVSMGRLTFHVRVPDNNMLQVPRVLDGYETKVKISETEKGFVFLG